LDSLEVRDITQPILREGREKFHLMVGIVSQIAAGQYEIFDVSSETGIPQVGDVFDLAGVYCREVYKTGETVAITEIEGQKGMCLHPLYTVIACEAYISSPIIVNGVTWGTLNFTSFDIREAAFSADEIAMRSATDCLQERGRRDPKGRWHQLTGREPEDIDRDLWLKTHVLS